MRGSSRQSGDQRPPQSSSLLLFLFACGCGLVAYICFRSAVPRVTLDTLQARADLAAPPNRRRVLEPSPAAERPTTLERSPPPGPRIGVPELLVSFAPKGREAQFKTVVREIDASRDQVRGHAWALKVVDACVGAMANLKADNLIPVWVTLLLSDEIELETIMLPSIDVPVRHFHFVWNGDSEEMKKRVDVLRKIPHCVTVHHDPLNLGFAGSVNSGVHHGEEKAKELGIDLSQDWYFIANPDAGFPPGQLDRYAVQTNREKHRYAMTYGPREDHFAFGLTRLAIDTVGLRDAAIYPIYMEDIEYRWRTQLAGLQLLVTGAQFNHVQSVNLRKHTDTAQRTRDALRRSGNGICYVRQKWGYYDFNEINHFGPPSGWKKPFKLESAPLKLWAIDPVHRECLRTGRGPYFPHSDCCWYNASVLLDQLPPGTRIPPPNDMPRNMHRGM
jgi:hypothetical protein